MVPGSVVACCQGQVFGASGVIGAGVRRAAGRSGHCGTMSVRDSRGFVDIGYIAGVECILGGRVGEKPDVQGFRLAPLLRSELER